ncbi:MAG: hypothetical protein Q9170_002775 [Blastenia crenularia]
MPQYMLFGHRFVKGAPASGSQDSPTCAAQNIESKMIPGQYTKPVTSIPKKIALLILGLTWKMSRYRKKIASLLKNMAANIVPWKTLACTSSMADPMCDGNTARLNLRVSKRSIDVFEVRNLHESRIEQ